MDTVRAVDPAAGPVVRIMLLAGRRRRTVRLVLATLTVVMAVALLPYALWEGPAPMWALAGLPITVVLLFAAPLGAQLAEARHTVGEDELGRGSEAAGILIGAEAACRHFDEAVGSLTGETGWAASARRQLQDAHWATARRARTLAGLDLSLADLRRRSGGMGGTEEQRLAERRSSQRAGALELVAEMDSLAETAQQVAYLAGGRSAGRGPDWSERERSTVEALRRHRAHLQALGSAWEEVSPTSVREDNRA